MHSSLNPSPLPTPPFLSSNPPLASTPTTTKKEPSMSEEEEIRTFSLLRLLDHIATPLLPPNEKIIEALFEFGFLSSKVLPGEDYFSYFEQECGLRASSYREALFWASKLQQVIETGYIDMNEGQEFFQLLVTEITKRKDSLAPGDSFTLMGDFSSSFSIGSNPLVGSIARAFFPDSISKQLLENQSKSIETVAEELIQSFSEPIKEILVHIFPQATEELVHKIFNFGLQDCLPMLLQKGMTERGAKQLSNSFKKHLKKRFCRLFPKTCHSEIEKFAADIAAFGINQAIHLQMEFLKKTVSKQFTEKIHASQTALRSSLPEFLKILLGMSDIGQSAVWLEIKRQKDGRFTLIITGMGAALNFHPIKRSEGKPFAPLQIAFHHLEANTLDHSFFFRFCALQTWQKWSINPTGSLKYFYETLLPSIKSTPQSVKETICEKEHLETITTPWALLQELSFSQNKIVNSTEKKIHIFNRKKEVWLKIWNAYTLDKKNKILLNQIHLINKHMINIALSFEKAGLIDELELKSIYSTVKEIDQIIISDQNTPTTPPVLAQVEKTPEQFLSGLMQKIGGTHRRCQAAKQALLEVFGEEARPALETAFQYSPKESDKTHYSLPDDLPTLSSLQEALKNSISNLKANWTTLQTDLQEWDSWDMFFFAIDCIFKAKRVFSSFILIPSASPVAMILMRQINNLLPQARLVRAICMIFINTTIIFLLPRVVAKLAPRRVKIKIDTIAQKIINTICDLEEKALYYSLRYILPLFLGKKRLRAIKAEIIIFQQQWIERSGQLSLEREKEAMICDTHTLSPLPEVITFPTQKKEILTASTVISMQSDAIRSSNSHTTTAHPIEQKEIKDPLLTLIQSAHDRINEISKLNPEMMWQSLFLLFQQFPVPTLEENSIWNNCKDPAAVLEEVILLIEHLSRFLENLKTNHSYRFFLVMKLVTIADCLARQCKDSLLKGYSTTPIILVKMLNNFRFSVYGPNESAILRQIFAYYQIDPLKNYTDEEFKKIDEENVLRTDYLLYPHQINRTTQDLFCYDSAESDYRNIFPNGSVFIDLSKLIKSLSKLLSASGLISKYSICNYFMKLLDTEQVKIRLSAFPFKLKENEENCLWDFSNQDKKNNLIRGFISLLIDTPLNEELIEDNNKELIKKISNNYDPKDRRKGVLPRSYHLLQTAHIILLHNDHAKNLFIPDNQPRCVALCETKKRTILDILTGAPPIENLLIFPSQNPIAAFCADSQLFYSDFISDKQIKHPSQESMYNPSEGSEYRSIAYAPIKNYFNYISPVDKIKNNEIKQIANDLQNALLDVKEDFLRILAKADSLIEQLRKNEEIAITSSNTVKNNFAIEALFTILEDCAMRFNMLDQHLERAPQMSCALGDFFARKMQLPHCEERENRWQQEVVITLKWMQLGVKIRRFCFHYSQESIKHFPDFGHHLLTIYRNKVALHNENACDFNLIFQCLTSLYIDESFQPLTQEKDEFYTTFFCAIAAKFKHETLPIWLLSKKYRQSFLKSKLENLIGGPSNEKKIDQLLSKVALYCGKIPESLSMQPLCWEGDFPFYRSGKIELDFSLDTQQTINSSFSLQTAIEAYLFAILKCHPSFFEVREGEFSIPAYGLTLICEPEFSDENISTAQFRLYHHRKGVIYRLLAREQSTLFIKNTPTIEKSADSCLWIPIDCQTCEQEKNELLVGCPQEITAPETFKIIPLKTIDKFEDGTYTLSWNRKLVSKLLNSQECTLKDTYALTHSEIKTHLSALTWFTPLEKIQAYWSSKEDHLIEQIELQEHGLIFQTDKIADHQKVAICTIYPGFFIARDQSCMQLHPHSKYLILENKRGERRLLLSCIPIEQLVIAHACRSFSDKIDHFMLTPLFEKQYNYFQNSTSLPSYHLFTITEEGYLHSEELSATAYLLLYSFSQKRNKEVQRILIELQSRCKLEKFDPSSTRLLLQFSFLLGVLGISTQDNDSAIQSLKVMALLHENTLLPSVEEQPPTDFLIANIAITYMVYRTVLESKIIKHLSNYEELLILNFLSYSISTLIESKIDADKWIKRLNKICSIDEAIPHLIFTASMNDRLRILKRKYRVHKEDHLDLLSKCFDQLLQPQQPEYIKEKCKQITPNQLRKATGKIKSFITNNVANLKNNADKRKKKFIFNLNVLKRCKINRFFKTAKKKIETLPFPSDLSIEDACKKLFNEILNPSWRFQYPETITRMINFDYWAVIIEKSTPGRNTLTVPLDLETYKPFHFQKYFLSYYALALNDIPHTIKQNPKAAELFQLNRERLRIFLEKLPIYGMHHEGILFQLLKMIMQKERPIQYSMASLKNDFIHLFNKTKNDQKKHLCLVFQRLFHYYKEEKTINNQTKLVTQITTGVAFTYSKHYLISTTKNKTAELVLQFLMPQLSFIKRAASWGEYAIQFVKKEHRIVSLAKDETSQKKPISLSSHLESQYLTTDTTLLMKEIDLHTDLSLEAIIKTHFIIKEEVESLIPSPLKIKGEISPVDTFHLDEFNQSCIDFHQKNNTPRTTVALREKQSLEEATATLKELYETLKEIVDYEKDELLALVNQEKVKKRNEKLSIREKMQAQRGIALNSSRKQLLTFDDIKKLFLDDDLCAWIDQTLLSQNEINRFKEKLYLHFVKITRLMQLKNCLEQSQKILITEEKKQATLLPNLIADLKVSRAYDFAKLPEKIIRSHLIFEAVNKIMLWEGQTRQVDTMLLDRGAKIAVESIMGSGKTYFGVPTTNYVAANSNTFIINIWTAAALQMSTKLTASQCRRSFNQLSHAIHITRKTHLSKNILWGLLRRFQNALESKEQIHFSKTEMQSLDLRMLLLAKELRDPTVHSNLGTKELFYLGSLLFLIRTQGVASVDETQENFEQRNELNYPVGPPSAVKMEWIKVIQKLIRVLIQDEYFNSFIKLNTTQSALSEKVYELQVKKPLALKLAQWPSLDIAPHDIESVADYMSGISETVPVCVKKSTKRAPIDLIKGMLTLILPKTLALKPREHYGPSHIIGQDEYARPYEACDKPNEQATIRSPFEAILKTHFSFLYSRLNTDQANKLAKILYLKAKKNKKLLLEETPEAKLLLSCFPGIPFTLLKQECFEEAHKYYIDSDQAVLLYAAEVCKTIKYYKQNIKNDSQNFGSLFKGFYGFTGSPYSHKTYPEGTTLLFDKGTQGETKYLLEHMQQVGSVAIFDGAGPIENLKAILSQHFSAQTKMSAIIDRGAVFRGMSNKEIAESILSFLSSSITNIKGVVYYNQSNEIVVLERGRKEPCLFALSALKPEERITYFDQAHTYASDILQPLDGEAIVTIGDRIKIEELAQAVWRMRGLRKGQKIRFAIPQFVASLISKNDLPTLEEIYAFAFLNQSKELTTAYYLSRIQMIRNIIRSAVRDKMLSVFDQDTIPLHAHSQWKSLLSSKDTLSFENFLNPQVKQFLNYFAEFETVFIETDEDDPVKIFGGIEKIVPTSQLLEQIIKKEFTCVKKSATFTEDEKQHIWNSLLPLKDGLFQEKVSIAVEDEKPNLFPFELFGKEQSVETSLESQLQAEQQIELDQQRELDQQKEISTEKESKSKKLYKWASPYRWNPDLACFDLRWIQTEKIVPKRLLLKNQAIKTCKEVIALGNLFFKTMMDQKIPESYCEEKKIHRELDAHVPLYRFCDFLAMSKDQAVAEAASLFDSVLFTTHNFSPAAPRGVFSCAIDPLTKNRKPISELLVIEDAREYSKKKLQLGLIDYSDVEYWRERLSKKPPFPSEIKIAIYNLALGIFTTTSDPNWKEVSLHENPQFMKAIVQAKFYEGYTDYNQLETRALNSWLENSDVGKLERAFKSIIQSTSQSKNAIGFAGSDLDFAFSQHHLEPIQRL